MVFNECNISNYFSFINKWNLKKMWNTILECDMLKINNTFNLGTILSSFFVTIVLVKNYNNWTIWNYCLLMHKLVIETFNWNLYFKYNFLQQIFIMLFLWLLREILCRLFNIYTYKFQSNFELYQILIKCEENPFGWKSKKYFKRNKYMQNNSRVTIFIRCGEINFGTR